MIRSPICSQSWAVRMSTSRMNAKSGIRGVQASKKPIRSKNTCRTNRNVGSIWSTTWPTPISPTFTAPKSPSTLTPSPPIYWEPPMRAHATKNSLPISVPSSGCHIVLHLRAAKATQAGAAWFGLYKCSLPKVSNARIPQLILIILLISLSKVKTIYCRSKISAPTLT